MPNNEKVKELEKFATEIRLEAMKSLTHLGFGHVGGAMSVVETLAVLYGEVMNIDPKNPRWEDRDWLVMSKGHAGPALYAVRPLAADPGAEAASGRQNSSPGPARNRA